MLLLEALLAIQESIRAIHALHADMRPRASCAELVRYEGFEVRFSCGFVCARGADDGREGAK